MEKFGREVWAILESALVQMMARTAFMGNVPVVDAAVRGTQTTGSVIRIPVVGAITRRDSFWSMLFGGTSVEGLIGALREARNNSSAGTVLLDIDSPGGTVSGLPELAAEVRALKTAKRVVALANPLMASAAYWLGSQADEIIAAPEALVGSVGVFTTHEDLSEAYRAMGAKITFISAGRYKAEGNPTEPLSDEARAHLQALVDDAYGLFVADVARGRAVSENTVRGPKFGEGRVLTATDAKAAGMIDRVATFGETMRRLTGVRADDNGNGLALNALKRRRLELLTIGGQNESARTENQACGAHQPGPRCTRQG